ncbi:type II/IV secretion system protein [Candidatus Wolfebacteria bacterium]|nr:type II/IV secretion system protein [Candidatus Wolfebacteria bacterium]
MPTNKSEIEKELLAPANEISIIKLIDSLINHAYELRTSDIHIDPVENKVIIRFRIDGVMHNVFVLPKEIQSEVITRLKVLSGLRTDEHQIAQDGRFKFIAKDQKDFDVRISIIPTYHEENAVLRLLVEQGQDYNLENLGFSERDLDIVRDAMAKPYGMILTTGPTGSGKTTTLYTILKILNTDETAIITIEDPIEYSLEKIIQIQVNNQSGLSFANGLRSILRQDPNIVMVGEIRDEETAKIATNAALTGHLLLSTLHTNDAATALPRLIDMGVEPFLIVSTVNIIIAQRLVRRICPDCKTEKKYSISALKTLAHHSLSESLTSEFLTGDDKTFFVGKGCKNCNNSGYLGRIPIHEVLEITDAVREAVVSRLGAHEIKEIAKSEGMSTMIEDGFKKATAGSTTIEEILRAIHE